MLIIEDGTGKVDAQSYVTVDEVRAFAVARGLSVPSSDDAGNAQIETALVQAADYLETNLCYQGKKASSLQALQWPRSGVYFDDECYSKTAIPANLKTAQIRLALEVLKGIDLMPTISGTASDFVVKEKIGPIETEYANPSNYDGRATFTAVDALLASLLGLECRHSGSFTVYRG